MESIGKVILSVVATVIFALALTFLINMNNLTKPLPEQSFEIAEDKPTVIATRVLDPSVVYQIPSSQVVMELLYLEGDYNVNIDGKSLNEGDPTKTNEIKIKNKYEGYLAILNTKVEKNRVYEKSYTVDLDGNITEINYRIID